MNNLENPTRSARGAANDQQQLNFTPKDADANNRMFSGFLPPLGPPGQFPIAPFFPLNMFGNQSNLFEAAQQQQQQSNSIKQNQNGNVSSANAIDLEAPNPGLLQMILQNNQLAQQNATPNILLQHALLQKQQQQQQQQQQQLQQQKQQSAGPVPDSLQFLFQLQQQQQIQQQQQSQQQLLQQQTAGPSFSSSQLIQHLSRLNNPILLQQLYNTVTNPYENARFSSILLRLQQNAAANALANGNSIIPNNNSVSSQQVGGIPLTVSPIQNTTSQNIQQKLIQQQKQKEELTNMLEYLVERMHQVETDQIFEKKREFKFIAGEDLSIFDNIVHKYQFSKKTKEEMIKYILRKCFKFLKSNIKQQEIVGQKDIEVAFTRKYFGGELESQQQLQIQRQFMTSENHAASKDSDDSDEEKPQLQKSIMSYQVKEENIDQQQPQDEQIPRSNQAIQLPSSKNLPPASNNNLEQQEDIIEKVMPFKQGSKIKTMNIQFLKMIFHSEVFAKDYQLYLEKFEELAQKENQKKVQKCVKNLQDFIEKGQINKVRSYKRLPWLRIWLKETFELAKTLCVYAEDEPVREAEISNSETDLKKKQKLNISSSSKVNNGEESGLNDQQAASQSELNNKQPSEEQILEAIQDNAEWKTPQQVRRSPQRNSQTDVQRSPQRSSQTDTTSEKDTARFDIPHSRKSAELIQSLTSLSKLGEIQERIKREDIEQGNISPSSKIIYQKQE